MTYLLLFYEYFKTGLFAIGGGMATLPFLYDMSARHPDWFTTAQIADMLAVSESTPGPIGVNMATYVGFQVGGVLGAVIATIGLITPSIIVILIIAAFLRSFRDSRIVQSVFYGLRPASAAMVAAAGLSVAAVALLNSPGNDLPGPVAGAQKPVGPAAQGLGLQAAAAGVYGRPELMKIVAGHGHLCGQAV